MNIIEIKSDLVSALFTFGDIMVGMLNTPMFDGYDIINNGDGFTFLDMMTNETLLISIITLIVIKRITPFL